MPFYINRHVLGGTSMLLVLFCEQLHVKYCMKYRHVAGLMADPVYELGCRHIRPVFSEHFQNRQTHPSALPKAHQTRLTHWSSLKSSTRRRLCWGLRTAAADGGCSGVELSRPSSDCRLSPVTFSGSSAGLQCIDVTVTGHIQRVLCGITMHRRHCHRSHTAGPLWGGGGHNR